MDNALSCIAAWIGHFWFALGFGLSYVLGHGKHILEARADERTSSYLRGERVEPRYDLTILAGLVLARPFPCCRKPTPSQSDLVCGSQHGSVQRQPCGLAATTTVVCLGFCPSLPSLPAAAACVRVRPFLPSPPPPRASARPALCLSGALFPPLSPSALCPIVSCCGR